MLKEIGKSNVGRQLWVASRVLQALLSQTETNEKKNVGSSKRENRKSLSRFFSATLHSELFFICCFSNKTEE